MLAKVCLPFLEKIIAKIMQIIRREYVDMWELLPEFWSNPWGSEGAPRLERMKANSQQITVWAQYFALYVYVMAKEYPECVSELMAYMCTINCASQEYENSAWVAYDSAYRQQAVASKRIS